MGVFIVGMRPAQRVKALACIPLALAVIFVSSHGFLGTLKTFFMAGTSDPSVAHRVNTYPFVAQYGGQGALVRPRRWHLHRHKRSLHSWTMST